MGDAKCVGQNATYKSCLKVDAVLLARARGRRNTKSISQKSTVINMNTTIVSAEAKNRLTEAVRNYAPPASEKYQALNEIRESIVELRKRKASYQAIRAILHENAGIEVSHQTIARYCREVLDSARPKKPRQPKTPLPLPMTSAETSSAPIQTELAPRSATGSRRQKGPHIADSANL